MRCRQTLAAMVLPVMSALIGSSVLGAESPNTPSSLLDTPGAAVPGKTDDRGSLEQARYFQAGVVPPGAVVSSLKPPEPATAPTSQQAPAPTPLMALLTQVGVGDWFKQNQIDVYGWIQLSYTHNFENPRDPKLNTSRLFDAQDNNFLMNQLDVTFEKLVNLKGDRFDVGGRIDLLYGSDARFIHSSGMFDSEGALSPQYQFDIPQIYVDLGLPIGNGLRLRLGKFEFLKPTDPNLSPFYSHTFSYAFAGGGQIPGLSQRVSGTILGANLPYTLTGITGYYEFTKQLNVEVGISRGYDQTLEDNNDAINGFGKITYSLSDATTLSFAFIIGPEIADDNSHYRAVGDVSLVHSLTEDLTLLLDAEYGYQARPHRLEGITIGGDAHWYGVSGAGIYRITKQLSAAIRGEWYRDEQAYTTGIRQNLYEITAGVTLTPFADTSWGAGLKVRPEVRYDYSDQPYFKTDSDSLNHGQLTVAIDVIYNF